MVGFKLFSEDGEVRLVCRQTEHDEVCVSTVETVVGVGVMVRSVTLATNIVHHLWERKEE